MGHLDEVVELHATADDGLAHGAAVDARVGAYLHIVLDDHNAYLRNLVVAILVGGEAEAVGTDHTARMDGDAVAHLTPLIDGHVGIEQTLLADGHPVAYDHVGIDLGAIADGGAIANTGKGTNVNVGADGGLGRDERQRVDALLAGLHLLIELQQTGHGLVGVFHANQRGLHRTFQLQVIVDEHHRRLGFIKIMGVFGIGKEGDGPFASLFNLGKSANGGLFVTFHTATYQLSDLFGSKLHKKLLVFI